FSLPAVLALTAIDGILSIAAKALTRGCNAALLLPHKALREGNAILNMGFSISGATGPALAGLLVAAFGASSALLVDAATFVTVALIIATAQELRVDSDPTTNSFGRVKAGVREAWGHIGVRRLLIAQSVAFIFLGSAVPVEVV